MKPGSAVRPAPLAGIAAQEAKEGLSPVARLLLWDFSRGSLAYDILLLVVLVLLLLVPPSWWNDPMRSFL
ncbi:MAG TPA: hypothetical protein VFO85_10170 [Vicinamibacteria bacterium]|nr:hypothetical protein [Vicinamibacteria bacterium]